MGMYDKPRPKDKTVAINKRLGHYDPVIALRICELIADGKTLTDVVKTEGMPSRATIYRWLAAFPQFGEAFERAREVSAQSFEDEALELARILTTEGSTFNGTKVRAFEVAMAQLRWSAARRDPKRYGATQQGNTAIAVQINTSLNLGQDGPLDISASTAPVTNVYTFEATPIPQDAEATDSEGLEATPSDPLLDFTPENEDTAPLPFNVPLEQKQTIRPPKQRKTPAGRPVGWRKGHKSPGKTAMTIAAQERARLRKEAKKNGTVSDDAKPADRPAGDDA
jgi:hypothetical protein